LNFFITVYFKDFTYENLEITNFQTNPNKKICHLLLPTKNFEFDELLSSKNYFLLSTKPITNFLNIFLLEGQI